MPADELHKAITLNSLSTNASKAIGPAIGGLVIALSGPYVVFAINAVSFVIITLILYLRFPKNIGTPSPLPPEHFTQALRGGLTYTLHDQVLRTVLIRCIVFFIFASAFWSLMPALLIRNFHASAQTYGILMALTGVGSVIGAVIMPRLYRRWSRNKLFGFTSGLYGCGLILLAGAQTLWAVGLIAALLGLAWMTSFSALMIACQLTVPDWVRARALAILMLSYGISATPGSALWGYLADSKLGIAGSMAIAGTGALLTIILGKWLPLSSQSRDHTPSPHWQMPPNTDIEHLAGPVTVTRKYQVDEPQQPVFRELMARIRAVRRRNGAISWQLSEYIQGNYTETIVIADWLDYLRHRERMTIDDRQLEEQIIKLSKDQQPPLTEYSVANHRWLHTNH